MAVWKQYCKELKNNLDYNAAWLPNTEFKLGDFGIVKNDKFETHGNIGNSPYKIKFSVRKHNSASLNYSSSGVTTTNISGNVNVAPIIKAGFKIKFSKKNSVFFNAAGVNIVSISNLAQVSKHILELYQDKKWNKDYIFISHLVTAKKTTCLISKDNGAEITLESKTNIPTINLASPKINLDIKYSNKITTKIVTEKGLTPLFRLRGVTTSFVPWGDPSMASFLVSVIPE